MTLCIIGSLICMSVPPHNYPHIIITGINGKTKINFVHSRTMLMIQNEKLNSFGYCKFGIHLFQVEIVLWCRSLVRVDGSFSKTPYLLYTVKYSKDLIT